MVAMWKRIAELLSRRTVHARWHSSSRRRAPPEHNQWTEPPCARATSRPCWMPTKAPSRLPSRPSGGSKAVRARCRRRAPGLPAEVPDLRNRRSLDAFRQLATGLLDRHLHELGSFALLTVVELADDADHVGAVGSAPVLVAIDHPVIAVAAVVFTAAMSGRRTARSWRMPRDSRPRPYARLLVARFSMAGAER